MHPPKIWMFPEIRGAISGVPITWDYGILGSTSGPPYGGKVPFRILLGLVKLHIVLISSLNPGGYIWGGGVL